MKTAALKFIGGVALVATVFLGVVFLIVSVGSLGGCAVGRGAAGEVVLGWDAGKLVETTDQAIIGIGDKLGTWLGLGGGGVGALALAGWTAARARLTEHKNTWDEAVGTPAANLPPSAPASAGAGGGGAATPPAAA